MAPLRRRRRHRPRPARHRHQPAAGRQVDELQAEIERLLQDSKADDVIADLGAAGVPAGRIRTVPEVYDWEQVRGLGLLHTMTHQLAG